MANITTEHPLEMINVCEVGHNDLQLHLVEVRPQPESVDTALGPATPIRPDLGSRGFEVTWYGYVAFVITNESYYRGARDNASPPFDPHAVQDRLSTTQKSAFLDYVAATTIAGDPFPGELTHWSLYTEWHCIDLVSAEAPEIRELDLSEVSAIVASRGSR